ncbi:MAG TPA: hybrid sensor histidine kinase/response regulator [Gammaproteobacteria bacterium]|nr:hybrid sensor histidine kinase/response regulator [Gammaproteobacteria bacterium]
MIIKKLYLCLFFLLIPVHLLAAGNSPAVASFTAIDKQLELQPYIQILPDPDRSLSIDDVVNGARKNDFRPVSDIGDSFGFTKSAYWVRFTVYFDQTLKDTVLLQLDYPLIDNITLFIPDGQAGFEKKLSGDARAFSERDISHRNFLFVLPVHAAESRTYYMRIQTEGSTQIELSLWTATAFIEQVDRSNLILGIYYGIMLLLMIAALASFIKIRDRLFLSYAFYLFSYLIFQLSLNGLSYQYLWPEFPWFTSRATSVFVGLVVIGGIVFSGSFLQIWDNKHPRVKGLFYALIVFAGISIILSLFGDYALAVRIASASGLLLPPVVLVGAINAVIAGYKPARYFLVAWGIFVLGVFVTGLLYVGILPHTFFTLYSIQIGSTLEVILLGYAVMDRVDISHSEENEAIEEANRYISRFYDGLEILVDERTQQLSESEAQLRTLIHALPDLVWWKDPDGVFMGCNPKFERLLGAAQEDILGKTDYDFFDRERADFFREKDQLSVEAGLPCFNEEEVIYADDGHVELLEVIKMPMYGPNNELIGVLGVGRDITERRRSELALLNTQKMEAIGQLTGGIAHDFNNILAIVIGNLSLLKSELLTDDKAIKRIETIQKSTQRAADLTRQLLSFSRNKADQRVVTDINQVLDDMDSLIVHSVTPAIEVKHEFASDLWLTRIDPGDFQDAMINLVINARDAMTGSGRLILKTSNRTLDEKDCVLCPEREVGDYVQLAVTDNGEGMSSSQQARIFEPFYTTKEQGKGTGLGLAMVFGFVKRSGGCIAVESEPGVGTTICFYLPRCKGEMETKQEPDIDIINEHHRGRETILVVDDEAALLELTREILEELSYRVLTAVNSKQALEILAEEPDVALLLSDVLMPGGMNGYELAETAIEGNPNLKILLASGYTSKSEIHRSQARFSKNMLTKPYSLSELARRVRLVLDS